MDITAILLPFCILSLINSVSPDASGVSESERSDSIKMPVFSQSSSSSQQQHQPPDYYPYNVTINHRSPNSVEVSWNCRGQNIHDKYDKYEVMLKPLEASYRVIETVPYNTCYLIMDKLEPNTNYKVSVTSIYGRIRKRSSSVIFRTYMEDYTEITDEDSNEAVEAEEKRPNKDRLRLPRVRLVEISLVGMALILWAGAIVLFFHRWGKIRMLLPYQPDYKEMKRNNSIVCANCSMTPHHQYCRIHQMTYAAAGDCAGGGGVGGSLPGQPSMPMGNKPEVVSASVGCVPVTDAGCSPIRERLNSFIVYDINECRKNHPLGGMCRKAKSAEQLEHYNYNSPFLDDCIVDTTDCTDF